MSTLADKLGRKDTTRASSRQVRVALSTLNIWSTLKISLISGVVVGVITIIMGMIIWSVLSSNGSIAQLDTFAADALGSTKSTTFSSLITLKAVVGLCSIIAVLQIILTAIGGVILAALYNLSVKITGGLLVGFNND